MPCLQGSENLPTMPPDGKIPKDLYKKYGSTILEADGFAQVQPLDSHAAQHPLCPYCAAPLLDLFAQSVLSPRLAT